MPHPHHYRRVVVMVQEGHAEAPAFHLAAELAHLLGLDLEGLFVENEPLLSLAALPFARELRLPGHTWQALDPHQMLENFRHSAGIARRHLGEAAAELGVSSAFSVLRGDPASALAEHAGAEDILVLVEPGAALSPGMHGPESDVLRRAHSGVLLVPGRPYRRRGAIAVVLPAEQTGIVEVAAAIARAAGEDLVLISASLPDARLETAAHTSGLPPARLSRRHVQRLDALSIARALRAAGARLVLVDRARPGAAGEEFLARLLAESGIAVLLVGESPAA